MNFFGHNITHCKNVHKNKQTKTNWKRMLGVDQKQSWLCEWEPSPRLTTAILKQWTALHTAAVVQRVLLRYSMLSTTPSMHSFTARSCRRRWAWSWMPSRAEAIKGQCQAPPSLERSVPSTLLLLTASWLEILQLWTIKQHWETRIKMLTPLYKGIFYLLKLLKDHLPKEKDYRALSPCHNLLWRWRFGGTQTFWFPT